MAVKNFLYSLYTVGMEKALMVEFKRKIVESIKCTARRTTGNFFRENKKLVSKWGSLYEE